MALEVMVPVRLSREQWHNLEAIAIRQQTTVSDLIREAVEVMITVYAEIEKEKNADRPPRRPPSNYVAGRRQDAAGRLFRLGIVGTSPAHW